MNWTRLKVFLLTLICFGAFALLLKTIRLGHRIDSWKASTNTALEKRQQAINALGSAVASRPFPSYKKRCEGLGGVHARLHDATANVLYDEICMFGRLPDDLPTCLERAVDKE